MGKEQHSISQYQIKSFYKFFFIFHHVIMMDDKLLEELSKMSR